MVAVGATFLHGLAPGYRHGVYGHGVAYVSEVGLVAVAAGGGTGVGLVVVVGAATAARVCVPRGQLAAAPAGHTRPPQGQTVSVVGEHRRP